MNEFPIPIFDDIKYSIFYRGQDFPSQNINESPKAYGKILVHKYTHEIGEIRNTYDAIYEAMETRSKPMFEKPNLVIEDLELDYKEYGIYPPTILMPRCLYFPYFGG